MIYQMTVTPAEEAPAFRIRFCSESFSLPGFSWPMELLNGAHFHHHLQQRGCSLKQREVIVQWMDNPLTEMCSVSREGEIHLISSDTLPLYEEKASDTASERVLVVIHLPSGEMLPAVFPRKADTKMVDLLRHIVRRMTERGEENFNGERVLFYDKYEKRIDFMDDALIVHDFMKIGIVEDDHRVLRYVHREAYEAGEAVEWM